MNEKIIVPVLGESITEATVAKWLKNKGDKVNVDEPIVELETDKVNLEVPSPTDGILTDINSENGKTVEVGSVLGIIEAVSEAEKKIEKVQPVEEEKKEKVTKKTEPTQKKESDQRSKESSNIVNLEFEKNQSPKIFDDNIIEEEPLILTKEFSEEKEERSLNKNKNLSPAVRKIISDKNIDINQIKGTGKDGRVLKGDLLNLMNEAPKANERKLKFGEEERIQMSKLRQTIAKRLKEAQNNAAMLTTFNEVDMTEIIKMRKDNQNDFQKRFGVKLGFMSFFVKACVLGLKLFPSINAEIENNEIIYKNYYNISFAVGTDRGLVVPVIKNADEMTFAEIEKEIKLLSDKAREGKLVIDDLQGGTFTISNGGVYGSMLSTPILNPPQSGVLGMHNIVDRPISINNEIIVRPIMYLALSYDHRIIDGKESVSFLKTIKQNLEDPRRLFLDI
tara:strand:+ start:1228 stop:2574 length:1347 start_codon:yes stop_codon:yes gene_type:complete